ncbi:MAG: hypothetical protein VX627_00535 [Candidatus Thermoplasmatota archaeon]|nr:hypothetical protein [Candidatus Thermoplasmatota archaeon]
MSEKKQGRRKRNERREGLFDDLVDLSDFEIDERAKGLRASISATEQGLDAIQSERAALITLVQSLREIQEYAKGMSKERNKLLGKFRSIRGKADNLRTERDAINEAIPPPLEIIERKLNQTYRRLSVIPNDLTRMPNHHHEIQLFSFFFELQAMHKQKSRGNELHRQYVQLLRNQEEKLKELDKLNEKKSLESEEEPSETESKANPKEIKRINNEIAEMLENIRSQRRDLKTSRMEAGRLEACLRMRKKSTKQTSRRIGPRIEDVKQRASSGEMLSIEDLSALLKEGGLDSLRDEKTENDLKEDSKPVKSQKRQVGASRGRRRTTTSEDRERRRG